MVKKFSRTPAFSANFLGVLLITELAECHLIWVDTIWENFWLLAAKMTQFWLGIVQQLALWLTVFYFLSVMYMSKGPFVQKLRKSI